MVCMVWKQRVGPLLVVIGLLSAGVVTQAGTEANLSPAHGSTLAGPLESQWHAAPLDMPQDPRSLLELVDAWDQRLGTSHTALELAPLTDLPAHTQTTVRDLLSVLLFVQQVRDEEYRTIEDGELTKHLHTETPEPDALALIADVDEKRLQRAAVTLAQAVDQALPVLMETGPAAPRPLPATTLNAPLVDLAPVFVMDPLGEDNLFDKDAVLMIDLGGDDVYDANAGGSMIHRGLVGDPESCQHHAAGFSIGCENEDSFEAYTASLLIDVQGDDTYGVYKPPRAGSRDALCGGDEIIRRVVTYGSGSGGVGMLVDVTGNDAYRGKTLSMGHGHLAGVGAFFDLSGDDTYQAVRSAMGSSILQGSGFLLDGAGQDTYRFQAPANGLFNVDRGFCDTSARLGLGSAVIQGTATFLDEAGDDTYRVESQALGHVEAFGAAQFLDLGGNDDYGGYPERGNDQQWVGEETFVDQD